MQKSWLKKGLVCGIIGILICISTTPLIEYVRADEPGYEIALGKLGYNSQRELARTSDNTLHCVYVRLEGSYHRIYYAYSTNDGVTWTEESEPLSPPTQECYLPCIAVDQYDNIHVAWSWERAPPGPGWYATIQYRVKTTSWQGIEDVITGYYLAPSLAVDSGGVVHLAIGGYGGGAYHGAGVQYLKKVTPSSSWSSPYPVSSSGWANLPELVVDGNNDIHILYLHAPRYGPYYGLRYRRTIGGVWQGEEIVQEDDGPWSVGSMALDNTGNVYVVWCHGTTGWVRIRERTSGGWQTPDDVFLPDGYSQQSPVVSIDMNDNIHVVWCGKHANSPNCYQIRYRQYPLDGSPPQDITSASVDQGNPNLIWSWYPVVNGVHPNRPKNGYAFVWNDGSIIRFYKSADLVWEGGGNQPPTTDEWPMFHHDLSHSGYSTSAAPNTNNVLWTYTTGGGVYSSPAVVDGKVYVGSYDNKVYCLDANTGVKIWEYATGDWRSSSPAVADGKVYIGSGCPITHEGDTNIYCLNAETGEKIWNYTAGGVVISSPAVANGKVYVGSWNGKVYCLNAETGEKIWDYTTNGYVESSPAVFNGKVYIGSGHPSLGGDTKLYCLDANTGVKIWDYTTGGAVHSSPAIAYGRVYFSSFDGKLYCLNADTGVKIWDYPSGYSIPSPAVAYGKVYIGNEEGIMYCLDAATGTYVWSYLIGADIDPSPAVADGKIYFGSDDKKVYCLNAETGAWIWDYATGYGEVASSPAVADGKVYIGSSDGKVYCFGGNQPPTIWTEVQKLLASDGAGGDWFARSVALDGNTALVGAEGDDGYKGAAYVFTRIGTTWTQQQKLLASDRDEYDNFGYSVSLDGDTALIGAVDNYNTGSAYVFIRSGTTWTQQAKLFALDGATGDHFGVSVSLSGDTALIGAGLDDNRKGSAYVFTRTGTTWTQQQKILASDGAAQDYFGSCVSLSGDTALIGANQDDIAKGSAYVFTRTGTTWTQQQKILASDGVALDRFGSSVSIDGDTALIGANGDTDNGINTGSAYVFIRTGTTWTQQAKLLASDGITQDWFGLSVSLSGDTALIGAYYDDDNGEKSGSSYVFTRTGTTWTQQQKILASDGAEYDYFGSCVSLDGDTALIGSWDDDSIGSAYMFTKESGNQPPNPPTLKSPGTPTDTGRIVDTKTPPFEWNEVPNAEYYGLYISKEPYGEENIVYNSEKQYPGGKLYGTLFDQLPDDILEDGIKYRWDMRAFNDYGTSDFSTELYFKVDLKPTCNIILKKDENQIDNIDVGQTFDICITDYSNDIAYISFLSDENQNGVVDPGYQWNSPYKWDESLGGWDADTKTMKWSFATGGPKEVWVEVNDTIGQTNWSHADIYVNFYFIHLTDIHYGKSKARYKVNMIIDDIINLTPKPEFVIISGDLLDYGYDSGVLCDRFDNNLWLLGTHDCWSNTYSLLNNDLQKLINAGIQYFICPGNHDYYEYYGYNPVIPYHTMNLDNYYIFSSLFDPDKDGRYSVTISGLHIISINSGFDTLPDFDWINPVPLQGSGLTSENSNDIQWINNDLNNLDGEYKKIIFMHHPVIYYGGWRKANTWDNGIIKNNKESFMNLCEQYDVDLILSGHTHDSKVYNRSMDGITIEGYQLNPISSSLSNEPLYVVTGAASEGSYRIIRCEKDDIKVYKHNYIIPTVKGEISGCPVQLHLYDSNENHVGRNDTGGLDLEIENATYSFSPLEYTNEIDPTKWNHTIEEISLVYGIDNYKYQLIGTGEGVFNFSIEKRLTDGSEIVVLYNNISISNNSIGELFVYNDSVDYTIYMDDNRDDIIDREIQPDQIISDEVPYPPVKPSGPTIGHSNTIYNYLTNTTDPENGQVYYLFDWGGGTDSGWSGPFDSEEICSESHSWIQNGIYQIKVRAKDAIEHISDWSNTLTIVIDDTPPITTKTVGNPKYGENDVWITSSTEFNLNALDDLSGVQAIYYHIWYNNAWTTWIEYIGNFTLTNEGKHYLEYYSVDKAGNVEEVHNQTHYVDDTSPSTSCTLSGTIGQNAWYTSTVTVTLTATDAQSGVNTTSYRIDGGSWQKYTSIFTLSSNGSHIVEYYSTDLLGNTESIQSVSIKIDKTLPTLNITKPEKGYLYICDKKITYVGQNIAIGGITVKVNTSDTVSCIAKVEFYVDNKLKSTDNTAPYSWKWNEKTFFKHKLKTVTYDQAGSTKTAEMDVWVFNW